MQHITSDFSFIITILILLTAPSISLIDITPYDYPKPSNELNSDHIVAILGTNDIHGAFFPQFIQDPQTDIKYSFGGLEYLGKYISILRKMWGKNFLWLDGGDLFQGGLESKQSKGDIISEFYNTMKLDACTIGNHEWDFGQNFLKTKMSKAKFPFLVSNIKNTTTNKDVFLPNQIKTKIFKTGPVKIGVIGITTITTIETTVGDLSSVEFLNYLDIIVSLAKELREKTHAVILLAHVGLKCLNDGNSKLELTIRDRKTPQEECEHSEELHILLNRLPKHTVDLVIAAHKHDVTHHWINGTPVISSLNNGVYANIAYLSFNKFKGYKLKRKDILLEGPLPICEKVFTNTKRCSPMTSKELLYAGDLVKFSFHGVVIEKEKKLHYLHKKYWEHYASFLNTPVSKTEDVLKVNKNYETSLGNLYCDIVKRLTNADISVLNAGGFRNSWNPGIISIANIYGMSPFENRVVSFEMTGKEVKMMLKEIQGGRYSFYPTSGLKLVVSKKPKKSLISAKLYDGVYERDIIENQVYVVGTVDFNLPFGGDDFRAVKKWYEVRNLKTFGILRDEITDYLKNINIVKHNNFYRYDKPRLKIIERTRFDLFDKEFYDNDNEQGDNDDNIITHNDIHYNKHFKKHYKYNKKNNKA